MYMKSIVYESLIQNWQKRKLDFGFIWRHIFYFNILKSGDNSDVQLQFCSSFCTEINQVYALSEYFFL